MEILVTEEEGKKKMRSTYIVPLLSTKGNLQAGFKSVLTYSSNAKPERMGGALPQDYIPVVCTSVCSPEPLQQSQDRLYHPFAFCRGCLCREMQAGGRMDSRGEELQGKWERALWKL